MFQKACRNSDKLFMPKSRRMLTFLDGDIDASRARPMMMLATANASAIFATL